MKQTSISPALHRLYLYTPLAMVALLQNVVHESLHYALARLMGEPVVAFRLFTNGFLTSQVIFAMPMDERAGPHWLLIAWGPALITTLAGFTVYFLRNRLITRSGFANLMIWYLGALFMTIDPLYFGVISWFMGGSDINAAQAIGWPNWPVQVFGLAICALSVWLVLRWREAARADVQRYRAWQS